MSFHYAGRPVTFQNILCVTLLTLICHPPQVFADDTDFQQRHADVKERFEKRRDKPQNRLVHDPPMIKSKDSTLEVDEAVIGVEFNDEARAYPLTMLFGGGGIFELLNDTCGDVPIAVSW